MASITQQAWARVNAIHETAEREIAAVRQQADSQVAAIRDAAGREAATILALPGASGRAAGPAPERAPRQRAALPAASADLPVSQATRPEAPVPRHATEFLPPDPGPPGAMPGPPGGLPGGRPRPR